MPASVPSAKTTAEFWKWFQANEDRLFALTQDDEEHMEAILDEITAAIEAVHPDLTCEFSSIVKGKRELIISAGGLREAFPAVEALVDAAPELPRWTLFKFRQRQKKLHDIQMENTLVKADTVECAVASDDRKVAVLVFIPGVRDEMQRKEIGYTLLDEALGEHDVETKISAIEIISSDKLLDYPRFPIKDLAKKFDELYRHLNP